MRKAPSFGFLSELYVQVLLAILLGALVGYLWPQVGTSLQPLADGFIKLIKMLLSPIIFGTVVVGIAKMSDIKDGAANTILMAEVPPVFKRPWLAGGGATVVGVPEKNSFKPFVAAEKDGKRGSYVIMADGSVRFVANSIAFPVWQALGTRAGGEVLDSSQF